MSASKASSPDPLRLHIGGEEVKPGWKILNAQARPGVDFVGLAHDLSQFADASVSEIYASHVYEHLDYKDELPKALSEAHRVLKPSGLIRIGVPDLAVLAKLLTRPGMGPQEHWDLMRVFYGGHTDKWDYHYSGFTFELLASLLTEQGFQFVRRVESFGLFDDGTETRCFNTRISLNVQGMKAGR